MFASSQFGLLDDHWPTLGYITKCQVLWDPGRTWVLYKSRFFLMSPQIGSSSMFCLRNSWRGISGRKGKSGDSNWTSGRCGGDNFLTSLHFSPMVGFNLKYLKQAGDVEETVFDFQEDLSSGNYNVLLAMGIGNPNQRGCHMSSCKQHCNQLGQIFLGI